MARQPPKLPKSSSTPPEPVSVRVSRMTTHPLDGFSDPDDNLIDALRLATIEIRYAADAAADLLDAVFTEGAAMIPSDGYKLNPNREINDKIAHALGHAALISRCLNSRGRLHAPKREKEFHSKRASVIAHSLVGIDVMALKDRDVRDSIEHLEEHIERHLAKRPPRPRPPLFYNFAISSRPALPPSSVLCRVYICDEERFENLTTSIKLRPLRNTLRSVARHLRNEQEAGGGLILQ